MRALTDSERTLVMENQKLVYAVVYKMVRSGKLSPRLVEDAISEGMIGLIQAAIYYDQSRGTQFSTLATVSIHRCIVMFFKKEINQTKYDCASLDAPIGEKTGRTLGEILPAKDDVEQDAVRWLKEVIAEIPMDRVRAKHIEILMEYVNGRNMREIAEERGVSKQRIQYIISEAKRILRNHLNRKDWV